MEQDIDTMSAEELRDALRMAQEAKKKDIVIKVSPKGCVYQVSLNKDHYYCNCPGYRRQKTIGKHKHIRLLQFWKNQLEQPEGCSLWFEGVNDEDIEYRIFIPPNEALKKILIC